MDWRFSLVRVGLARLQLGVEVDEIRQLALRREPLLLRTGDAEVLITLVADLAVELYVRHVHHLVGRGRLRADVEAARHGGEVHVQCEVPAPVEAADVEQT